MQAARARARARARAPEHRGYVMLTVLVIMLLIAMAGAQALKASGDEQRANARFRNSGLLAHAADAGAAQRLSEAALATDLRAISDDLYSPSHASWTDWPTSSVGFTSLPADRMALVRFRTGAIRRRAVGVRPPPGVASSTNACIFEFDSYAAYNNTDPSSSLSDATVTVAFKAWDTLSGNYAP